jgi:transcriptional regulator with XRE-family HTH domain
MDSRARLRTIMRREGVTHAALARRVRTRRHTVTEWLTGRKNPNTEHRLKLSELYGLDPLGWTKPIRAA